ncbi:unnamed protein product, partial [marine sediment metagenome]
RNQFFIWFNISILKGKYYAVISVSSAELNNHFY